MKIPRSRPAVRPSRRCSHKEEQAGIKVERTSRLPSVGKDCNFGTTRTDTNAICLAVSTLWAHASSPWLPQIDLVGGRYLFLFASFRGGLLLESLMVSQKMRMVSVPVRGETRATVNVLLDSRTERLYGMMRTLSRFLLI